MFIQSCVFLRGNGACISWGESFDSHVDFFTNVEQIQTTARACAAVLEDGKARGLGELMDVQRATRKTWVSFKGLKDLNDMELYSY